MSREKEDSVEESFFIQYKLYFWVKLETLIHIFQYIYNKQTRSDLPFFLTDRLTDWQTDWLTDWLYSKNPDKSVDPHDFFKRKQKIWLTDLVITDRLDDWLPNWLGWTQSLHSFHGVISPFKKIWIWTVLNHLQSNLMTQIRLWV